MDEKELELTSDLELGADRRTVLKWLLGGAGAVVAGIAVSDSIAAEGDDDDDDDNYPPADDDDDDDDDNYPPADDDDDDDDDDNYPPADDDDDDDDDNYPPADDDDDDDDYGHGGKPYPPKKSYPPKDGAYTDSGTYVSAMPNTGSGSSSSSTGILGVATVGAAAAYFAGKYLRQADPEAASSEE